MMAPISEPKKFAEMAAVPKAKAKVRICVNLTHLSEYICSERHILSAIKETFAKLSGVTVFEKFDARTCW